RIGSSRAFSLVRLIEPGSHVDSLAWAEALAPGSASRIPTRPGIPTRRDARAGQRFTGPEATKRCGVGRPPGGRRGRGPIAPRARAGRDPTRLGAHASIDKLGYLKDFQGGRAAWAGRRG